LQPVVAVLMFVLLSALRVNPLILPQNISAVSSATGHFYRDEVQKFSVLNFLFP